MAIAQQEDRARPEALPRLQRAGAGPHPAGPRDRRSGRSTSRPTRRCATSLAHRARQLRGAQGADLGRCSASTASPRRWRWRPRSTRKVPDDLMVYGMLTDANIELGNYDDAEKSAPVDARPASRQHPGADPGRLPARAVRRHRGRARADAGGLRPHAVPGDRGSGLGADPDRPPRTASGSVPPRPNGRSSRRWSCSRTITTRSAAWPRSGRRSSATARPPTCSGGATRSRRIPRTSTSWPKPRREPGMTAEAAQSYAQFEAGARARDAAARTTPTASWSATWSAPARSPRRGWPWPSRRSPGARTSTPARPMPGRCSRTAGGPRRARRSPRCSRSASSIRGCWSGRR